MTIVKLSRSAGLVAAAVALLALAACDQTPPVKGPGAPSAQTATTAAPPPPTAPRPPPPI